MSRKIDRKFGLCNPKNFSFSLPSFFHPLIHQIKRLINFRTDPFLLKRHSLGMFTYKDTCHVACLVPVRFIKHVVFNTYTIDDQVPETDMTNQVVVASTDGKATW